MVVWMGSLEDSRKMEIIVINLFDAEDSTRSKSEEDREENTPRRRHYYHELVITIKTIPRGAPSTCETFSGKFSSQGAPLEEKVYGSLQRRCLDDQMSYIHYLKNGSNGTNSLSFKTRPFFRARPQKNIDGEDGSLSGIKMARQCPEVSHILFADDSLIFLHANELVAGKFLSILEEYCEASGQQINFDKSSVIFSPNTSNDLKGKILEVLKIPESSEKGKYLGIPAVFAGRWNISKLRDHVSDEVISDIKSIPLSLTNANDRIVWHYNLKGAAAIGVIGRNSEGKLVFQSELFAIREPCLIARQNHLLNAIIESDCKEAIKLCSSDLAPPWDSAVLIEDIRSVVSEF
ncbi:hypothetical protein AgCh_006173 [Apium graveolens]